MRGPPEEDVVLHGPHRTIAWARDAQGHRHAMEFLEKVAPDKDRARIYHVFRVMVDTGRVSNEESFRKEKGKIWGFKSHQLRIGAFQEGNVWYLTHAFIKQQNRWPPEELRRAERIRKEHLKRQESKG